jgi:hypothetical protein
VPVGSAKDRSDPKNSAGVDLMSVNILYEFQPGRSYHCVTIKMSNDSAQPVT